MPSWLPGDLVESVGWTLLHFMWQGLAIGALLAICLRLLGNHSSSHRYLAACIALVCVAAAPMATFYHFAPRKSVERAVALIPEAMPANASKIEVSEYGNGPITKVVAVHKAAVAKHSFSQKLKAALPWMVLTWFAGVFVFSIRLFFGWWKVNRLKRAAGTPLDEVWTRRITELARRLAINRSLRVVQSALVEVPTVIGWLRPVILLPVSCIVGLDPAQLEAVLAHELAHIRRNDYLVNLMQSVVETILFYHPIVWWISRRIREEREHCCDDLAVKVCGDPVAYARALATLEELRPAPAQLSLAASGAPLLERIRRLLAQPDRTTRSAWPLAGVVVVLLLIGVAVSSRGHRVLAANVNTEQTGIANATQSADSRSVITNTNATSQTNRVDLATLVKNGKFYYEANRLDEAEDTLSRAIQLDPSSVAANYYLRLVKEKRQSEDATRQSEFAAANALLQVEQSWNVEQRNGQLIPRPNEFNRTNLIYTTKGRQNILSKLDRIRIDSFKFDNQKLSEAIRQLSGVAKANDPDREGINFMLNKNPFVGPGGETNDISEVVVRLNTTLRNVRLADVLDVIAKCTDKPIKYAIMDYAVAFRVRDPNDPPPLEIRTFRVNLADFLGLSASSYGSGVSNAGPRVLRPGAAHTNDIDGVNHVVRQFFQAAGLDFNTNELSGKTFIYNDRKGVLTVRATAQDLDLISAALEAGRADFDGSPNSAIIFPTSPTPQEHYQKIKAVNEVRLLKKEKILEQLQALTPAELRQVLPGKVPDSILTALLQELQSAQNHLANLREAYEPNHPEVKRAQAQVDGLNLHINQRIAGIMEGIKTDLATSEAIIKNAEAKMKVLRPKPAAKLDRIHIDPVQFSNTPFADAVNQLNQLAAAGDPDKTGMNFIVEGSPHPALSHVDPDKGVSPLVPALDDPLTPARVTLSWQGGSLADFLDAMVATADRPATYSLHDYGILFSVKHPEPPLLAIRTFRVDPDALKTKLEAMTGPIPENGSGLSDAMRQFLVNIGIPVEKNAQDGRTFIYGDRRGILTLRATPDELHRAEEELRSVTPSDTMVRVQVQQPTITSSNTPTTEIRTYQFDSRALRARLQELANQAPKAGSKETNPDDMQRFLAEAGVDPRVMIVYHENHGTMTARGSRDELDRLGKALDPFSTKDTRIHFKVTVAEVPVDQSKSISPGFVLGCDPVPGEPGTFTVAEFIATGTNAFSTNHVNLRTILSTNSGSLLTGVMSPEQCKVALQQFEQRDGVDVLSAPQLIDFDRKAARIEVSTGQTVVVGTANAPVPLMVFTGISLGLIPHLQDDGKSIEIEATPTFTEFLGYDKPPTSAPGAGGKPAGLTPLPHFRVLEMRTKATIRDGQTLVLGGPYVNTVTTKTSKVPVLGDIPLISPLFRSKSSKTVTKHLVIMITPTIVGSDGTTTSW